jgi:IS30 family transposase
MKGQHLNYAHRIILEDEIRHNSLNVTQLAERFHCARATIYNEKKRGAEPYLARGKKIKFRPYKAAYAQEIYEQHRSESHRLEFFEEFPEIKKRLLALLKPKKGQKKISVEVALFLLSKDFINLPSARTVYYDIERGKLGKQVQKWVIGYRKKKKFEKKQNKRVLGTSIEERPEIINQRLEFGHWELDLVIGKREKGEVLITLLERVTNYYIVLRAADKKAHTIFSELEKLFETRGRQLFKSLTTDNGSEFALLPEFKDLPVYYCHPYSSWEKGANERHNHFLREFIPKGTKIENYSDEEILSAQTQLNQYPRPSKNFSTPEELFLQNVA